MRRNEFEAEKKIKERNRFPKSSQEGIISQFEKIILPSVAPRQKAAEMTLASPNPYESSRRGSIRNWCCNTGLYGLFKFRV